MVLVSFYEYCWLCEQWELTYMAVSYSNAQQLLQSDAVRLPRIVLAV